MGLQLNPYPEGGRFRHYFATLRGAQIEIMEKKMETTILFRV